MRGLRYKEVRRARALRQTAPAAEDRLWQKLRGRALNGLKFARQVSIGPYFADFVCREEKLVVEVDGATHSTDEELAYDERRSAFLRGEGYRIVRVPNIDIRENMTGVLETILAALERRTTW